jgi:hypothetical protein
MPRLDLDLLCWLERLQGLLQQLNRRQQAAGADNFPEVHKTSVDIGTFSYQYFLRQGSGMHNDQFM